MVKIKRLKAGYGLDDHGYIVSDVSKDKLVISMLLAYKILS